MKDTEVIQHHFCKIYTYFRNAEFVSLKQTGYVVTKTNIENG